LEPTIAASFVIALPVQFMGRIVSRVADRR
jgi:hypothetical protein